ncbi:hypothetical protein P3T73_07635 [Kiritimatiellota bacterium B12222]|nr:hypothetical protein P3T73_07635 [Kiritimatiellota bacterium B12222]
MNQSHSAPFIKGIDHTGAAPYSFAMSTLWFFLLLGFSVTSVSFASELGAYQLILDKQLLGVEKVVPQVMPAPAVTQAAPSWARDYRMTMMTQDGTGLRIGLQNLRDQSSFLLVEGQSWNDDAPVLVSGDYSSGTARVRFRGMEHVFTIETGPVALVSSGHAEAVPTTTSSVRDRRRGFRQRSTNKEATPEPVIRKFETTKELNDHLQEQQMDAVRTGKPLLPISLTEKSDTQLVNEGVLPKL